MHARGRQQQHGKPCRWRARAKPESRKGQAGPVRVAERSVLPERPGNAGGGKGPQVRRGEGKREGRREWHRLGPRCPGELEPPHAKAKGSECRNERKPGRQALAAGREQVCRRVRRPAGRSRGRATPATRTALADAPFPTEPDLPVCERHDPTGEPGALNRHAGFGERGAETWQCERMRHPHDAKAAGKRLLPHAKAGASLPDSTNRDLEIS